MSKISGLTSKIKSSIYHTASAIGVIGTGCLATNALGAITFYTADSTNSSILTNQLIYFNCWTRSSNIR